MSPRTRGVAVAVKACKLASGNRWRSTAIWRYSGRKSCPQWLMQCASSIAKRRTLSRSTSGKNEPEKSRSGATNKQPKFSCRYFCLGRPAFRGSQATVQAAGRIAAGRKAVDLILHQRDQRRDDDVGCPVERRRHLITERFAPARGHHHQRIAASQRRLDGFALHRPERIEAPVPPHDFENLLSLHSDSLSGAMRGARGGRKAEG